MSREKGRILVIDDSLVIQRLVELRLRADGFDVVTCASGEAGIAAARNVQPDVILLDVDMPGMDGYETCRRLKSDASTKIIPVIFLTARVKTEEKVRGLDSGALDYVAKPFDPVELRARVRSAYRTKYLMELLEQKAQVDGLTGLYNRSFLNSRLNEEVERAQRHGHPLAIVMADVDRFKTLNDSHGHAFGDQVLVEVAEAVRSICRVADAVCRYGGEEFVLVLPEQTGESACAVAERTRATIEGLRLDHNGVIVPVSASFGVAALEHEPLSPQELLERADKALYFSKENGRNRVSCWQNAEPVAACC